MPMPTEFAPPDPLIDALVADFHAVTPRQWRREAAFVAALVMAELLFFLTMRGARPDMADAMATPAMWWKILSPAAIALLAVAAALMSLDPAVTTPRRTAPLWWTIGLAAPLAVAAGWVIDAGASGQAALLARLDWRAGVDCLFGVVILALPPVLALGVLVRRGASTQPARTAAAAGLAAAAFAAFIFAFHCDHDDPLYVMVWYGGAVAGITLLSRLILPRLSRW